MTSKESLSSSPLPNGWDRVRSFVRWEIETDGPFIRNIIDQWSHDIYWSLTEAVYQIQQNPNLHIRKTITPALAYSLLILPSAELSPLFQTQEPLCITTTYFDTHEQQALAFDTVADPIRISGHVLKIGQCFFLDPEKTTYQGYDHWNWGYDQPYISVVNPESKSNWWVPIKYIDPTPSQRSRIVFQAISDIRKLVGANDNAGAIARAQWLVDNYHLAPSAQSLLNNLDALGKSVEPTPLPTRTPLATKTPLPTRTPLPTLTRPPSPLPTLRSEPPPQRAVPSVVPSSIPTEQTLSYAPLPPKESISGAPTLIVPKVPEKEEDRRYIIAAAGLTILATICSSIAIALPPGRPKPPKYT